jgi:septum formation protein
VHARAVAQLRACAAQDRGVPDGGGGGLPRQRLFPQDLAPVRVRFRTLNDHEIEAYLQAEQPYDCAGSAKSEGLGIALLDSIVNDDPTALVGLPLIRTSRMLRAAGVDLW